jgi:AmiR/NasT family two-component response regulator
VEEQAIAAMLATHAATALLAADRQTQFESALASRDVIGQAKGMLMERFKIDAVRAFALMTQLSQDNNVKLRTIAQQIVETN